MPALGRFVQGSSTALLFQILEQPRLLAAVRELPAPVLARLIEHVGLEDAGELIALTSTEQLGEVFDADLWRASEAGADETFSAQRFALWLRMMHEAGERFVVERLCALPRELLCLAVHRLVLVLNVDVLAERIGNAPSYDTDVDAIEKALDDAPFEEWEEFRLIARDPGAWDDVWGALLALDKEHHDRLREILERCCDLSGELIDEQGLYEVLTLDEARERRGRGSQRAAGLPGLRQPGRRAKLLATHRSGARLERSGWTRPDHARVFSRARTRAGQRTRGPARRPEPVVGSSCRSAAPGRGCSAQPGRPARVAAGGAGHGRHRRAGDAAARSRSHGRRTGGRHRARGRVPGADADGGDDGRASWPGSSASRSAHGRARLPRERDHRGGVPRGSQLPSDRGDRMRARSL